MSGNVTPRLRFEILKRDGHRCRYCGAGAPETDLVVDHVVPRSLGGRTVPENLVAACVPCNTGKASVAPGADLVADVEVDAVRWARAIKRASVARQTDRERVAAIVQAIEAEWADWTYKPYQGARRKPIPRPGDWDLTIARLVSLGLDLQDFHHYLDLTMRNKKVRAEKAWVYFCGCCWNGLSDLQNDAKSLLSDDDA